MLKLYIYTLDATVIDLVQSSFLDLIQINYLITLSVPSSLLPKVKFSINLISAAERILFSPHSLSILRIGYISFSLLYSVQKLEDVQYSSQLVHYGSAEYHFSEPGATKGVSLAGC